MSLPVKSLISNPELSGGDRKATGWNTFSPRPELAPWFSVCESTSGKRRLRIEANGDEYAFGCWCTEICMEAGKWYSASVSVQTAELNDARLDVFASAGGHYLEIHDAGNDRLYLNQTFQFKGGESHSNLFELFLRCTATGWVEWYEPCLAEIDAPQKRMARVATVRFPDIEEPGDMTLDALRNRIEYYLDEAGKVSPDLVLLTECSPESGLDENNIAQFTKIGVSNRDYSKFCYQTAEEVPNGPSCLMISKAAARYNMYVVAGLTEKRGKHVFNTAVIFDRKGKFVGQYDKTHITFGEMLVGISCGKNYPVFDLDFGRVAIHICYDEWFPEVSRLYALKGAEIILLPVAGGKPITWRTRAMDSRMYFISASTTPQSMIIDASGVVLAETHHGGFVYADLEMDFRKVNYYKDHTLYGGMPGIAPEMQHTIDDKLLDELGDIYKERRVRHD